MPPVDKGQASKLEDIPNIGKSIAADLRAIGILHPQQLATHKPLATYFALAARMGHRHDPCVLYALMAAQYYLESGESRPWWKFTEQGKRLLATQTQKHPTLPGQRMTSMTKETDKP
jgi:DNA transformation protein